MPTFGSNFCCDDWQRHRIDQGHHALAQILKRAINSIALGLQWVRSEPFQTSWTRLSSQVCLAYNKKLAWDLDQWSRVQVYNDQDRCHELLYSFHHFWPVSTFTTGQLSDTTGQAHAWHPYSVVSVFLPDFSTRCLTKTWEPVFQSYRTRRWRKFPQIRNLYMGRRCGIQLVRKSIEFRFNCFACHLVWDSMDLRFKPFEIQLLWNSIGLRFKCFSCQFIWDSTAFENQWILRFKWFAIQLLWDSNILLSIDLRIERFGCQLIRDSSGLVVDHWFGIQMVWDPSTWLENQVMWDLNDFKFKWFQTQLLRDSIGVKLIRLEIQLIGKSSHSIWDSIDVGFNWFEIRNSKNEAWKLKSKVFLRNFLQN